MKKVNYLLMLIILIAASLEVTAQGIAIRDIRVSVDYDDAYTYRLERKDRLSSESGLSNGSIIKAEILPGSNVTFTYWVENTYPSTGEDIRRISSIVTIEDLDDGSDFEFESDEFDLDTGNDYRIDVKFEIPIDVDRGTYNVIIEAQGEDKGARDYKTQSSLKMEVRKQSHDIRILESKLVPSVISCNRDTKLLAQVVNAGQSDENDAALEFRSSALGINSFDRDIELKSSEDASVDEKSYTKSLDIEIPKFIEAGKYQVLVNLYWKNYILFDQEKLELEVRDCNPIRANNSVKQEIIINQNETKINNITKRSTTQTSISTYAAPSIFSNNLFAMLTIGGIIVVLIFSVIAFWYMK